MMLRQVNAASDATRATSSKSNAQKENKFDVNILM